MEILKGKEEMFNQLFKKKVIVNKNKKDAKLVEIYLEATEPKLSRLFNNLYQKYRKGTQQDFISDCILLSWEAIERFEIEGNGNWEDILDGLDQLNRKKLISYISNSVRFNIIKKVNPDLKYTTRQIEGKKQHVAILFDSISLSTLIMDSESEVELGEKVDSTQSVWSNSFKNDYKVSAFIEWFQQNKERILIKSQLDFLEKMKGAQKVEGYTDNDIEELTGVPANKVSKKLKRIEIRVLKAWENERENHEKSFSAREKEAEIRLWNKPITIFYNAEPSVQNAELTKWLMGNFNKSKVANIVYDSLNFEDSKIVTRHINQENNKALPVHILNQIMVSIFKRQKELKIPAIKSNKVYKEPNLKFQAWEEEEKERRKQPCLVYKNDELVDVLYDNAITVGTKIVRLTTDGFELEKG